MSMSAQGFQNPDNGPSYYKFSTSVLYRFNVNNSRGLDGAPDLQIDFRFKDTYRDEPDVRLVLWNDQFDRQPRHFALRDLLVIIRDLKQNKSSPYTTRT